VIEAERERAKRERERERERGRAERERESGERERRERETDRRRERERERETDAERERERETDAEREREREKTTVSLFRDRACLTAARREWSFVASCGLKTKLQTCQFSTVPLGLSTSSQTTHTPPRWCATIGCAGAMAALARGRTVALARWPRWREAARSRGRRPPPRGRRAGAVARGALARPPRWRTSPRRAGATTALAHLTAALARPPRWRASPPRWRDHRAGAAARPRWRGYPRWRPISRASAQREVP
jgi:hypothetical protein